MKVENLDQTEAWKPATILPPGKHIVKIENAEEGTSNNGNPEIRLEMEATNGLGGVKDWITVLPQTYGKVKMLLDAAGIAVEGGEWELPIEALKGKVVMVYVSEKQDRNDPTKVRTEVKGYAAVDPSDVPADTSGLAGNGAAAGQIADEDIPF